MGNSVRVTNGGDVSLNALVVEKLGLKTTKNYVIDVCGDETGQSKQVIFIIQEKTDDHDSGWQSFQWTKKGATLRAKLLHLDIKELTQLIEPHKEKRTSVTYCWWKKHTTDYPDGVRKSKT